MKYKRFARMLSFAAALAVGDAQAAVIFTNLGPGDSFDPIGRYVIAPSYQIAAPFVPAANATFGSAELALAYNSGPNEYNVSLMTDSSGRPGTTIETLTLTGVGTDPGIYGVDSILRPTLVAGSQYWLTIFPPGSSSFDWYVNNQGDEEAAWGFPPLPWSGYAVNAVAPAFRINDTPLNGAPEPATLALLGLGFAGIGYQRRKRLVA